MIKLVGQSMTRGQRISPESCALNLTERTSTATLSLGPDAPEIAVGDWLLEDQEPGAGIVWRVKTLDETYNTATRTVTLEHAVNTLRDIALFGETKPENISGGPTCTARQAAEYVLQRQSIWRLGDFEYQDSAPFSFNGDDIFAAMEKICSVLDDPWWEYDMTRLPFVLHVRRRPTQTACEMRMGRNISTLRRTVDRSKMYTRIYPIGQKNLHITGEYLSKNEVIWGRRDKVETDQSQETEEKLRLWAMDRLNRHCEPQVTVTIGGLELSQATGERLDHLALGTVCQVPLPEFGVTITERITKLAWKDKIKEPENVTVTLCNVRQDLASIISEQAASSGGGRARAKEAEEDHAWFVDTTDHVAMVAEAIVGPDEHGEVDWSRVAEVVVDGQGVHAMVVRCDEEIKTAQTTIEMLEDTISLHAKRIDAVSGEISAAQVDIDAANRKISSLAGIVDEHGNLIEGARQLIDGANQRIEEQAGRIDAQGKLIDGAQVTIDGLKGEISQTVRKGDLISSINQSAEEIRISASKVNLDGYVTAKKLEAEYLTAQQIAATYITADEVSSFVSGEIDLERINADSGSIMDLSCGTLLVGQIDMGSHYHTFTPQTDGTIKIGGPTDTPGFFNIADTQFYKNGVSAARNGVKISAWEKGDYNDAMQTIPVYVTLTNGARDSYDVSTTEPFIAGFNAGLSSGAESVTLEDPTWGTSSTNASNSLMIKATNEESKTVNLYLTEGTWSNGSKRVYMRSDRNDGTIRAQRTISLPDSVSVSVSSVSGSSINLTITIGGKSYPATIRNPGTVS